MITQSLSIKCSVAVMKTTNLKKYGVDSYPKTQEFRNSHTISKHKIEHRILSTGFELVDEYDFMKDGKFNKFYRIRCTKCGNISKRTLVSLTKMKRKCPYCHTSNNLERLYFDFLKQNTDREVPAQLGDELDGLQYRQRLCPLSQT